MKNRLSVFLGCVLFAALLTGCGKEGPALGQLAPVSGKVTVDGKPVTAGQVSLVPIDASTQTGGSASAGSIDATGGYVINTAGKNGAPIGRYKVTVTPSMVPTGDNKMPTMPFNSKFTDPAKTTLIINVEANPPSGAYDLKLTP
jgi:hypothetical protein